MNGQTGARAVPLSLSRWLRPPHRPHPPASLACQSMLNHADKTGNGGVSMDDFYRLMKKQQGNKLDDLLGDDE